MRHLYCPNNDNEVSVSLCEPQNNNNNLKKKKNRFNRSALAKTR